MENEAPDSEEFVGGVFLSTPSNFSNIFGGKSFIGEIKGGATLAGYAPDPCMSAQFVCFTDAFAKGLVVVVADFE